MLQFESAVATAVIFVIWELCKMSAVPIAAKIKETTVAETAPTIDVKRPYVRNAGDLRAEVTVSIVFVLLVNILKKKKKKKIHNTTFFLAEEDEQENEHKQDAENDETGWVHEIVNFM
jgi:hypothetical protein